MDCDSDSSPIQDPVKRKLTFTEEKPTVTPLTRQFHALSLTDHEGRNDGEHARRAERDVCAVRQVGLGRLFHGSKDWSSRQEKPPVFDIMSTVKKSQKRPREEAPFQVYQPPVVNADEEYDKENMPVSYERQFSRRSEPHQGNGSKTTGCGGVSQCRGGYRHG